MLPLSWNASTTFPRNSTPEKKNHLQALGHVLLNDAGAGLEGAEVDDELVRAQAFSSAVEHVEVPVQLGGHVVGVQDGQLKTHTQNSKSKNKDM